MIHPKYPWLTQTFVAHRGLFDNDNKIPENSLPAFTKAATLGYAIETDVQMTKDGVLVVFHDDDLSRMTGMQGKLTDLTLQQLRQIRLLDTDCVIPTFDEFLHAANGVNIVVEIKPHGKTGKVEQKTRDALLDYKGHYCIESFDPFVVRWFKKNAPDVIRGQLSCDHKNSNLSAIKRYLLANLCLCGWNGAQFIAYDVNTVANVKAVARYAKKIPILGWTPRSQQQFDQVKPYVDNVIFDSFVPNEQSTQQQLSKHSNLL